MVKFPEEGNGPQFTYVSVLCSEEQLAKRRGWRCRCRVAPPSPSCMDGSEAQTRSFPEPRQQIVEILVQHSLRDIRGQMIAHREDGSFAVCEALEGSVYVGLHLFPFSECQIPANQVTFAVGSSRMLFSATCLLIRSPVLIGS